jgi:hypothetical protein
MKHITTTLFAVLAVLFAIACGGSDTDCEVCEDRIDAGSDVDAGDSAPEASVDPPTGQAACEQWETGFEDPQIISDCYYELGPDGVECAEETRQFWYLSCKGDCESLDVDQVACMCECMVIATPWDGEAGAPCSVDYEDLYNCWAGK